MEKTLIKEYNEKKELIRKALRKFKDLNEIEYYYEMMFCLLTPQSNALKCWDAIEELKKLKKFETDKINSILKTRTRFHNNKTKYILESGKTWNLIKNSLNNKNRLELRNELKKMVKGYGLKEAGHFLRNIGKSDNQIAILDRHILRNLKSLGVIETDKIKNDKHYLEMEQKFLEFSKRIGIPIDELDLLFWSRENGQIFK